MLSRHRFEAHVLFVGGLLVVACSVDNKGLPGGGGDASATDTASGGRTPAGTGGSLGTGGMIVAGTGGAAGAVGSGGAAATGGNIGTGTGGSATGGSATGGSATGGSATGGSATGGVPTVGTGGFRATGGAPASGGAVGSGGEIGSGGTVGSGGAVGSGGTVGTGGAALGGSGTGGASSGGMGTGGPGTGGGTPACGPSTCPNGCCNGTTCVTNRTDQRCGTAGAACAACGPCTQCSNMGVCGIIASSQWKVVCGSATIAPTKPGGGAWDVTASDATTLPDPYCQMTLDVTRRVTTSTVDQSLAPTWNESITPTSGANVTYSVLTSQPSRWSIAVMDEDSSGGILADDEICSVTPRLTAADFLAGTVKFPATDSCTSLEIRLVCAE